jgi:hypothetical protein
MDDPPPVRGGQRVGELDAEVQHLPQEQAAGLRSQRPAQIFPAQQLGNDEQPPVVHVGIEDHGDAWMLQPRGDRRLPDEPADLLLVGIGVPQHLDRHVPAEPKVAPAPHLAHPAAPQPAVKTVSASQNSPGFHPNAPSSASPAKQMIRPGKPGRTKGQRGIPLPRGARRR